MKLTCLSKGKGYHFPPCHIVNIGGFRILVDCPLDLSALSVFSPVPVYSDRTLEEDLNCSCHVSLDSDSALPKRQKTQNVIDASSLIYAVPWYKTVSSLHLWDISFIDVVLISSPMGMLGLPFFSRMKGFSAKIYATEVTTRIGQLMMEDLISMHREFRQFYGPEDPGCVQWMKWQELEKLPDVMQEVICGIDGTQLGGWLPLYSAADVKDCIQKVETLNYAEETCYGGSLVIKAFSSGLDLGSCNWVIRSPTRDATFLFSSVFASQALNFDYHPLEDHDVLLFSDFSSLDDIEGPEEELNHSPSISEISHGTPLELLLDTEESSKEEEKLEFIVSCAIDSVEAGGSVLIPIDRIGVVLQLLEQISSSLQCSSLKVPIFFVSSVAEELLSFTNIIPEWLCMERQKKLFAGEPLFSHADLVKNKKLHLLSSIHAPDLLNVWQEPCVVFTSHWSLRLGPVVHFLQHWHSDENSLLVIEKGLDANLSLLPYEPLAMKVLQCSFLSGISLNKVAPLLEMLRPKCVLFPEALETTVITLKPTPFSMLYYRENSQLRVPTSKRYADIEISTELATRLQWIKLTEDDINIARLHGDLSVKHGRHWLLLGSEPKEMSIDVGMLLSVLQKLGINASLQQASDGSGSAAVLTVDEPTKAVIEVQPMRIAISTADKYMASRIVEAVDTALSGDGK